MFLTRDYLKTDPWSAVIDMINNEYGVELQPLSTQLVSIESLGGTKTKIKIKTNISTSPENTMPKVELPEFLYYDRIDLKTMFKGGPLYVMDEVRLPLSTYQVMGMLDKKNEMMSSVNDLVPDQFLKFDTEYKLQANPKSLRFVGEIPFSFNNTLRFNLTSSAGVKEFPKANTWQLGNTGAKITGNYLFTAYDFTEYRDDIIPARGQHSFENVQRLRGMISKITGQSWVAEPELLDNNLCHSVYEGEPRVRVVYNGVRDPAYTSRQDMTYVMVLELSETRCSNVSGFLLLHYN